MIKGIILGVIGVPALLALALGEYCFRSGSSYGDSAGMKGFLGLVLLIVGGALALLDLIVWGL